MFSYVFVVLFTSGEEIEVAKRATSEGVARSMVYNSLTMEQMDNLEDIDLVEVNE